MSNMNQLTEYTARTERISERVQHSWAYYKPVFDYIRDNVPEDRLVSAQYNLWGDASASIRLDKISDITDFIASIVKACRLEILHHPSAEEMTKSTTLNWFLYPRGILLHPVPSFCITATADKCNLVKVGEETITRPIYEVKCD